MLSLCHMEMLSKKVCSSSALHKNSITRTIQQLAFSKPHQQPFHPFTTSTSQVSTMLTPQQVQDLEIVPNMFPSVDSIDQGDGFSMEILYNNEKVSYGSKMTPSQVKHEPTVHITVKDLNKYQPGHFFTLIMSDPDAPSRRDPKCREWLHWIKANMKINNDGSVSMKEVSNVADYMGSAPPKGTGYHRYVFSLFYHVGKLVHLKEHHWGPSNESRACFLASQFAKNHHMHDPVAIGCFEASHE
ncbi:hypothetical protein C9374_004719 [Naegleria lovaniensis]|uniref:Phosphatidylethanolamine-binding protein n=1 Tax=Naegleria lovaniensis TaxID=51637 RepID=A0AA88GRS4_NAELO|nr:uncharacterized protein C9374_004719 [Naegleria lovaniensis]KAG2383382.1 hypothetical protein C9374_004719 [Naegleria lovaniensis]